MIFILMYLFEHFTSGLVASPLPSELLYLTSQRATFTWITAPCFRDLRIGCCGFKPSKELLHVLRVGVDNDFFNITALGVP